MHRGKLRVFGRGVGCDTSTTAPIHSNQRLATNMKAPGRPTAASNAANGRAGRRRFRGQHRFKLLPKRIQSYRLAVLSPSRDPPPPHDERPARDLHPGPRPRPRRERPRNLPAREVRLRQPRRRHHPVAAGHGRRERHRGPRGGPGRRAGRRERLQAPGRLRPQLRAVVAAALRVPEQRRGGARRRRRGARGAPGRRRRRLLRRRRLRLRREPRRRAVHVLRRRQVRAQARRAEQGRKRERNSQLQRLISRPFSTRFG